MDNQNTYSYWYMRLSRGVLILVLMDNQNTVEHLWEEKENSCLNPCSNG